MLITFKVSNFLSFDEEVTFSMLAGKSKKHTSHSLPIGKGRNKTNVLKAAILYGANASGKSNFIKAIDFAKQLITEGLKTSFTNNLHFRLAPEMAGRPSKFEFEFESNGKCYAYGFSLLLLTRTFTEEWLFEVGKYNDKPVFERTVRENGKSNIELYTKFDTEGQKRFDVYRKDIKNNQLFLYEINDKNIDEITGVLPFQEAFRWFRENLLILYPQSKPLSLGIFLEEGETEELFGKFLTMFNTGVKSLNSVELKEEEVRSKIPDKLFETIQRDFASDGFTSAGINISGSRIYIHKNEGNELKYKKIITQHASKSGADAQLENFEIHEESDGTQRIIDLIPLLIMLAGSDTTVLIDEIDRSLHPELSHKLIEIFLSNSSNLPSQLIATTHESGLLDLGLLRRDEIWFVEKDNVGASRLFSLEEFTTKHDNRLRDAYLQGRYGAIQFIGNVSNLSWLKNIKPNKQR